MSPELAAMYRRDDVRVAKREWFRGWKSIWKGRIRQSEIESSHLETLHGAMPKMANPLEERPHAD